MPRRDRREEAGAVQNIWARGVDRCAIFRDEDDRLVYLDLLGYVVRRFKWQCLAYCLMTNHVHLLIRTPEPTMGRGMHHLHSFYALDFNRKYGRVGHLFQDRYGSNRIWTPGRLRLAVNYITENPVAAGLCKDPADWRWSSHAALAADDAPRWLSRPADVLAIQAELAALS
jgi:REP element-mobilizing transposase RayT